MTAEARAIERSIRRSTGYGDIVRDPKPKRKHRSPAKSLSYLDDLWREVVRMQWGGKCAVHVLGGCEGRLEAHHFVPRARMLLKHDPQNGVMLCHRAHELARFGAIRKSIEVTLGAERVAYLYDRERVLFKDYLAQKGITRLEFRKRTAAHLKALLEQSR
jgi:hypothetical protein